MQRGSNVLAKLPGLAASIFVISAAWIWADEPRQRAIAQKVVVRSDDIGVSADIHGKLGLPLGRLTTIQGRCVESGNTKENLDRSAFRIERIDGKPLDRPVELLVESFGLRDDNSLKIGQSYELRGYEHGRFHGVPHDAYQEYVRNGKPQFATETSYSFHTEFVFVTARRL